MNVVQLSGRLIKKGILTGEGKVLKFLLACSYRYQKQGVVKDALSTVPCVIFEAPEGLKEALDGKQTIYVEASGRVSRSSYEKPDGETLHSTEIILDPTTVVLRKQ